ncbi:peroxidase-like [Aricia agestis]|uniref:peroxidase-like n=1 Tax=Aricia agestis TaxID=91739 RepID=UPI001C209342|nr:peroxidase-like [Aricia agestis]
MLITKYSSIPVIVYLFSSVSGCFNSGWDFLLEDLFADVCPLLASTTTIVKDLLFSNVIEDDCPITKDLISDSMRCGRELSRAARKRANQLIKNGVSLETSSPALLHFFSSKLPNDVKKSAEVSHELLAATKLMQMKLSTEVTPNTFISFLENHCVRPHEIYCKPVSVSCIGSGKYRSIDGTCNNEKHPAWGRRGAPFTRITAPRYADGIYAMPKSRSSCPLPNPRLLSTGLFTDRPVASNVLSYLSMQWGQFITHDLVFQTMEVTDEGGIQCCLGNGRDILPQDMLHDKCIPICIPEDDPFYSKQGVKCLNFVRSVTTPRDDCSLGHAEQMNTVTSYLDGSPIYGSDPKIASKLRTRCGGRLREDKKKKGKRGFLPSVDDKLAVCDLRNISEPCYLAGDTRINQTPTLAVLHTLLLREHNRVADILSNLNPLWNDEKLYQEARRIVIAEIQHITYQEWLPLNFGEGYLRYYRISPTSLYNRDYNEDVNPGVINGFGAGAFRFLHTIIPDSIMTCPASYQSAYMYKLSDHYFNPYLLESSAESFNDILRGIVTQRAGEADSHCTGEITNMLFKSHNKWGLDLIAMDIQRGRDHGIGSYNDFRETCGLRRAKSFQDLAGEIPQDRINLLTKYYEHVDDIDLFVGGSLESDIQGSILGQTFQCIVAEQFYRTRIGDRFFYDNSEMPHSFTPEQLKEIKKASMARLICDNSDVRYVQRRAFELETKYNPKYSCEDYDAIPYVDLTAWKRPKYELYD